ncbi:MAG: DUF2752 domain-containing protein [Thermoleophilaceae bacterium]
MLWVVGFAAGFIASRLVELRGPRDDVALGGTRLPPLCAFRLITGHRCPSCGTTRAFLYMFRLEPLNAVRANVFSPVTFALTTIAVSRAAIRLAAARRTPRRSR